MVSRRDRALLAAVVGTLLLSNPAWAFPHGCRTELTYEYRAERADDLTSAVVGYDEHAAERRPILDCGSGHVGDRLCLFERRIGPDGTLRAESDSAVRVEGDRLNSPHEYVYFGGSAFYRSRANATDGGVVLSFRRVAPETVAERYAAPANGSVVPAAVRRAIDDGSASATITVRRGSTRAE